VNKTQFSERDICTKFITPSLREAGWDEMTQLREEVSYGMTPAQIVQDLPDLEEEDVRQSLAYAAALAQDEVHSLRAPDRCAFWRMLASRPGPRVPTQTGHEAIHIRTGGPLVDDGVFGLGDAQR